MEDLEMRTCGLFSLVLGVKDRVQGNSLCAVLPLIRYQCRIHYLSSRVTPGPSKRKWQRRPHVTIRRVQKANITELERIRESAGFHFSEMTKSLASVDNKGTIKSVTFSQTFD